jgi:hypothetical protein
MVHREHQHRAAVGDLRPRPPRERCARKVEAPAAHRLRELLEPPRTLGLVVQTQVVRLDVRLHVGRDLLDELSAALAERGSESGVTIRDSSDRSTGAVTVERGIDLDLRRRDDCVRDVVGREPIEQPDPALHGRRRRLHAWLTRRG